MQVVWISAMLLSLDDDLLAKVAENLDVSPWTDLGRLLCTSHRCLRVVRMLSLWTQMSQQLSASFRCGDVVRIRDSNLVPGVLDRLPAVWHDPRYDWLLPGCLETSIGTPVWPPSPEWARLVPQQQYARLMRYKIKVTSRLDKECMAAAKGLLKHYQRAYAHPQLEVALHGAIKWFIFSAFDDFGPLGIDVADMLADGWQAVSWSDTCVRETISEVLEHRLHIIQLQSGEHEEPTSGDEESGEEEGDEEGDEE